LKILNASTLIHTGWSTSVQPKIISVAETVKVKRTNGMQFKDGIRLISYYSETFGLLHDRTNWEEGHEVRKWEYCYLCLPVCSCGPEPEKKPFGDS
jgi:hypothetical protein